MHALGTLDELPPDYRQALSARNLVPLWPSLRALLPPHRPAQRTRPTHWAYPVSYTHLTLPTTR